MNKLIFCENNLIKDGELLSALDKIQRLSHSTI